MAHFYPKGFPRPGPAFAPKELYDAAHNYFPVVYTDVVPCNPKTKEFFFATRTIEPERGSVWFLGGRAKVGEPNEESAARHFTHGTGLSIEPGRFWEVSNFRIGHLIHRDNLESNTRDAGDALLVINLQPSEVVQLDHQVTTVGLNSAEYEGGAWYSPEALRHEGSPGPVRQFLRDYFDKQVMMGALEAATYEEGALRSAT